VLLVVLAPLLISVVVRAFGWSMLLGPEGLLNQAWMALGLPRLRCSTPRPRSSSRWCT
jgi:putative spermidine/putrescine transport system permease protein